MTYKANDIKDIISKILVDKRDEGGIKSLYI